MKRWKELCLLLFVLILSGCRQTPFITSGNVTDLESNKADDNSNSLNKNSETKEPVNLTWFSDINMWEPPSPWNTDPNTVQGAITKATGCTFTMDIPAVEGDTQLNLMLANDELPDIISIVDAATINQLTKSGKVWQMEDFLKKYDPQSHLLKDFPQDIKNEIIYLEGDWYSYPSHMTSPDLRKLYPPSCQYHLDVLTKGQNTAILFNGDLMEKAGITLDDLQTEEGVLAALEKVKNLNLKVNGKPVIPLLTDKATYKSPVFLDFTLDYLCDTFGAMLVDPEGNYRDLVLAPEMKHALKFINTALLKGYMEPDQLIQDNSAVKECIHDERVFCFIGNSANTDINLTNTTNYVSPGAIISSEGKIPVMNVQLQAGTGWIQTFVSKNCKYPEKAAKWLSYMSSREGMLLAIYGFEGIDYNFNEDGLLIKTQTGIENSKNYKETGVFAYAPFHNISFSDSVLPAPTDNHELIFTKIACAFGKDSEAKLYDATPLFALPNDLIDPNSDLGKVEAKILNYKESQIFKILMAKDEATFNELYDELITNLKLYGIDKIDSVRNEALQKNYKRYGITLKSINGD